MSRLIIHRSIHLVDVYPLGNVSGRDHPYRFFEESIFFIRHLDPSRFLLAWFIAFGVVLLPPLLRPAILAKVFRGDWFFSVCFLLYPCGSVIGGVDFERYFLWCSPFVLVLIGMAFEEPAPLLNRGWTLVGIGVLQAISQRFFWTVPLQFPMLDRLGPFHFLTSWGGEVTYTSLLSSYMERPIFLVLSLEYGLLFILFWVLNLRLSTESRIGVRRQNKSPKIR
jgi:hypothetical protein